MSARCTHSSRNQPSGNGLEQTVGLSEWTESQHAAPGFSLCYKDPLVRPGHSDLK